MEQESALSGEVLCKACGLCCQGVFHPYAYLYSSADTEIANNFDAIIVKEEAGQDAFQLPCPAFSKACTVYPQRPSVCASHQCDLLCTYLTGQATIEQAIDYVKEMQDLLKTLLPELQTLTGCTTINQPEKLLENALASLADEESRAIFKAENGGLLLRFGRFIHLKRKYFYSGLNTSAQTLAKA